MKIAILGFGRRISEVLQNLEKSFEAIDESLEIAGYYDVQEKYYQDKDVRRFDTPQELLDIVKPEGVLIGSPTDSHLEYIKLAMNSGAKVLTEKPAVLDREQTRDLVQYLSDRDSSNLMIGFPLRSAPAFRAGQNWLKEKGIGKLVSMEANELLMPYHGAYIAGDWRRKAEYGGSYLLDKAVHDFDLFNVLASSVPQRIVSFGGCGVFCEENKNTLEAINKNHKIYDAGSYGNNMLSRWSSRQDIFSDDSDITDHQSVMVTYQNGVVLTFHSNTHSALPQRYIQLVGTEGILRIDFVKNEVVGKRVESREEPEIIKIEAAGEHYGADAEMADDLRDAFLGKRPFTSKIEDGLLAGLVVMAADESLRTGEIINFQDFCTGII